MTTGTWFVLCDRNRAVPIAELEPRIAKLRGVVVHRHGEVFELAIHDRLTGHAATLSVGLSTEPHVAIEAAEIAERQQRPELAALDARYELLWDLASSDEVFNPLALTAGILQDASGGVIYDANEGRLV